MTNDTTEIRTGLAFWAPLIAAALALFIVAVDSTMMNVAVPTIVNDLSTDVSTIQGVIALYSLVMASLMLVGGKLGALKGVKRMFLTGLVIYGLGTLLAAVSWNATVLAIGWSLLEGVGAAFLLPLAFALLVTNYGPREQAIGFGILGGVQASAAAVGPILGGVLTTYFTWRWGFAAEVLIAIAIFPFARYVKEKVTAEPNMTLDWGGVVLAVAGLFPLVLGLILAGRFGWWHALRPFAVGDTAFNPFGLSPTPFLVGFGLLMLALFLHWQIRRERQGQTPLVRLRILKNSTFLLGISANIFEYMVIAGMLFIIPLFVQSAAGYSAFQSGLAILPFSIATFVVSLGTSGLSERIPAKRLIQVGIMVMIVGIALFFRVITVNITIGQMIVPLGLCGVGMGLLIANLVNLTLTSVDPNDSPEASGVNNTAGQLGNSLGTAIVGSLLMAFFLGNVVDAVLRDDGIQVSNQERNQIVVALEDARETITEAERKEFSATVPPNVQQQLDRFLDSSVVTAMQDTLLVIGSLLVIMLLLASFLSNAAQQQALPAREVPEVNS